MNTSAGVDFPYFHFKTKAAESWSLVLPCNKSSAGSPHPEPLDSSALSSISIVKGETEKQTPIVIFWASQRHTTEPHAYSDGRGLASSPVPRVVSYQVLVVSYTSPVLPLTLHHLSK